MQVRNGSFCTARRSASVLPTILATSWLASSWVSLPSPLRSGTHDAQVAGPQPEARNVKSTAPARIPRRRERRPRRDVVGAGLLDSARRARRILRTPGASRVAVWSRENRDSFMDCPFTVGGKGCGTGGRSTACVTKWWHIRNTVATFRSELVRRTTSTNLRSLMPQGSERGYGRLRKVSVAEASE